MVKDPQLSNYSLLIVTLFYILKSNSAIPLVNKNISRALFQKTFKFPDLWQTTPAIATSTSSSEIISENESVLKDVLQTNEITFVDSDEHADDKDMEKFYEFLQNGESVLRDTPSRPISFPESDITNLAFGFINRLDTKCPPCYTFTGFKCQPITNFDSEDVVSIDNCAVGATSTRTSFPSMIFTISIGVIFVSYS